MITFPGCYNSLCIHIYYYQIFMDHPHMPIELGWAYVKQVKQVNQILLKYKENDLALTKSFTAWWRGPGSTHIINKFFICFRQGLRSQGDSHKSGGKKKKKIIIKFGSHPTQWVMYLDVDIHKLCFEVFSVCICIYFLILYSVKIESWALEAHFY